MTPKHAPVQFFYREPNKATFTYFNGASTPTDYVIVRGSYASIRLSISGVVKIDPTTAALPVPVQPPPQLQPQPQPQLPQVPQLQEPVLVPPVYAPGRTRNDDDNPQVRALRETEEHARDASAVPAYLRDFDRTTPLPPRAPSDALCARLDAVLALATSPPPSQTTTAGSGGSGETAARLRGLSALLESERENSADLRPLDVGERASALAPFLASTVAHAGPWAVRLEALHCAALLCTTGEAFARAFVCGDCGGLAALARAAEDAVSAPEDSATAPTLAHALTVALHDMLASPSCVRAFVEPFSFPVSEAGDGETKPSESVTIVHVLTRLLAHCAETAPAMVEPAKVVLRVCRFYVQHVQPLTALADENEEKEEEEKEEEEKRECEAVAQLEGLGEALAECAAPEGLEETRDPMELEGAVAAVAAGGTLDVVARLLTCGNVVVRTALVTALARCVRPLFACRAGLLLLLRECAAVQRLVHALDPAPAPLSPRTRAPAARLARTITCHLHMARPLFACRVDSNGRQGNSDGSSEDALLRDLAELETLAGTSAAHAEALARTVVACGALPMLAVEAVRTARRPACDPARLRPLVAVLARGLLHATRCATPAIVSAVARVHSTLLLLPEVSSSNNAAATSIPGDIRWALREAAELARLAHVWAGSAEGARPVAELVRSIAQPVLPEHLGVLAPALALHGGIARSPSTPHRTALLQPGVLAALTQIIADCTAHLEAAARPLSCGAPATTAPRGNNNTGEYRRNFRHNNFGNNRNNGYSRGYGDEEERDENEDEDGVDAFAARWQRAQDVLPIAQLAVELVRALQDVLSVDEGTGLVAPALAERCVGLCLAAFALPFGTEGDDDTEGEADGEALTRLRKSAVEVVGRWCTPHEPEAMVRPLTHFGDCAVTAPRTLFAALGVLARLIGTPLHRTATEAFDAAAMRVLRATARARRAALHAPLMRVYTALAHAQPPLALRTTATVLLLDVAEEAEAAPAARTIALLWCALDGPAPLPCPAPRVAAVIVRALDAPGAAPAALGVVLGAARTFVAHCSAADAPAVDTVARAITTRCLTTTTATATTTAAGLAFFAHPDVRTCACRTALAEGLTAVRSDTEAHVRTLDGDGAQETAGLAQLSHCVFREYDGERMKDEQEEVRLAETTMEGAPSITEALLEAGLLEGDDGAGSTVVRELRRHHPGHGERAPALLGAARRQRFLGDCLTGSWFKGQSDARARPAKHARYTRQPVTAAAPSLLPPP